jgi:hypothetical protein
MIVLKHNNKASASLVDEEWSMLVDAMWGERECWPPSGISSINGKRTPSLGGSQYPTPTFAGSRDVVQAERLASFGEEGTPTSSSACSQRSRV